MKILGTLAILAIIGWFAINALGSAIDHEFTEWKCRTDLECMIEDYEVNYKTP